VPVTLKDAKITVKLDMADAEKQVESLEKKTKEQRKEDERERKKADKAVKKTGVKAGRRRGGVGGVIGGGVIAGTMQRVQTAGLGIPIVELAFVATIVGAAIAELNERFGPMAEAILEEILPSKLAKFVPDAHGFAIEWASMKAKLQSIETGFTQAVSMGAAIAMSGGTLTPGMFADIYGEERGMAEHNILYEKLKRFQRQRMVGGSLGGAINDTTRQLRDSIDKRVEQAIENNKKSKMNK